MTWPRYRRRRKLPSGKIQEEHGKGSAEEKEKEGKDEDKEDPEMPPLDRMSGNDLRQGGITIRREEEKEESERDLYSTRENPNMNCEVYHTH